MILTGKEIQREVSNGSISISPFIESSLNPNSYNYTLNKKLIEIYHNDGQLIKNEIEIGEEGFVLEPMRLYLGATNEKIGSSKYAVSLIGRSSIGRLGIHVQIAANLGHTGTYHSWTLEIRVSHKCRVYPNCNFGQVSFWSNTGEIDLYNGEYTNINVPHEGFKNKF